MSRAGMMMFGMWSLAVLAAVLHSAGHPALVILVGLVAFYAAGWYEGRKP